MEFVESALEVCEARAGARIILPAAMQRCPTLAANFFSRLAPALGHPCISLGRRQLLAASRDFLSRLQGLLKTPEPILGSVDLRCESLLAGSLFAEFIAYADELILRLCKPLLCLALCFLGFGQTAPAFIGALAGREEGRGKHGLPGLEYPADLTFEPLRFLNLGACASAGIEVGLHALQGVG